MSISTLSAPRGVKLSCEVCGRPATVQCLRCRVSYYCSTEHQECDWRSFHSTLCPHLPNLRNPAPLAGSTEERARRKQQTEKLQVDLATAAAQAASGFLLSGDYDLAVPAALQSLRLTVAVHGNNSPELVPSYLQLGEASVGLNRLGQAEEYLALARWLVLKNPSTPVLLQARLHRLTGRLQHEQGKIESAIREYAHGVYWAACANGPRSAQSAEAAFYLGSALMSGGNMEGGMSVYDEIVKIWDSVLQSDEDIEEVMIGAACAALDRIAAIREQEFTAESMETAEGYLVYGLMLERLGDSVRATESLTRAQKAVSNLPAAVKDMMAARIKQALGRQGNMTERNVL